MFYSGEVCATKGSEFRGCIVLLVPGFEVKGLLSVFGSRVLV